MTAPGAPQGSPETPPPPPFLPEDGSLFFFSHLSNPRLMRLDAVLLFLGGPAFMFFALRAINERGDAPGWVPLFIVGMGLVLIGFGVWCLYAAGRWSAWVKEYTRITGHEPRRYVRGGSQAG